MKNCKGEMTTQQIVILIILIISFAVILFFLFRLNLGQETVKETCRNSVVTRGSAIIPTEAVPLKCKREYICITEDRSCERMTKPIRYDVKTKEEVYGILARKMADCWWMFGEGKINYVGKDMLPKIYCSICYQVAFDDSLLEIFPEGKFDKRELYEYLATNNMSNSDQSYAEYLFGSKDVQNLVKVDDGTKEFGGVSINDQYYVLMGITSDVHRVMYVFGGAVTAGLVTLAVLSGPVGWVVGGVVVASVVGGTGGYLLAPVIRGDSGNDYISPSLVKANSDEFRGLDCERIATLS